MYYDQWRAGSGQSGVHNDCLIGQGWLPRGWYSQWGHFNHYDGTIKGRVWYWQDKWCHDGSALRTELFTHTEETADNGQYCPTSGDDRYCWDGAYDYYSNGCIKIAYPHAGFPNDVGDAHWRYHNYGGSATHGYFTDSNELYVYDG